MFPNAVVAEGVFDRLVSSSFHVHMQAKSCLFGWAAERLILAHPPVAEPAGNGSRLTKVAVIGDSPLARAISSHLAEVWTRGQERESDLELHLWCDLAEEQRADLLDECGGDSLAGRHVRVVAHRSARSLSEQGLSHAALCRAAREVLKELKGTGHVYVCLSPDHRTLAASQVLAESTKQQAGVGTTVTACLQNAGAAGRLLSSTAESSGAVEGPLDMFDVLETLRDPDLLEGFYEALARSIHAGYRKENPEAPSSRPWDDLSDTYRDQNKTKPSGMETICGPLAAASPGVGSSSTGHRNSP